MKMKWDRLENLERCGDSKRPLTATRLPTKSVQLATDIPYSHNSFSSMLNSLFTFRVEKIPGTATPYRHGLLEMTPDLGAVQLPLVDETADGPDGDGEILGHFVYPEVLLEGAGLHQLTARCLGGAARCLLFQFRISNR
jgi:hypothetical protein